MANYTFIYQAMANSQVDFSWMIGSEDAKQDTPVYVKKGDTVSFSLLPVPGSQETMVSLELSFQMLKTDEPVAPFEGYGANLVWKNGGPVLTIVDTPGKWDFGGVMNAIGKNGKPITYTLADPEVVVDDGPEASKD